ncbi:response regulator transcription factor [Gorillibacterium timonense]|uniref:response regulator transcription factor n=1 Tax=Gorillibacterium timonense TaxID=1689269 RepID=UPI00071D707E|nr:response regulator transcription factor [Gorillibacterium timonense]
MEYRILIVDDDPAIAGLVRIYLDHEGLECDTAADGAEGLSALEKKEYHLVVLDVMMPRMDGIEFCRRVREDRSIPILMLSAKAEEMDKITGMMTGADDYLAKPFHPLELVTRIKSLLRRTYQYNRPAERRTDGEIRIGPLLIDSRTHTAEVNGRNLHLTSKEFGILHLLASQPGRVMGAEDIFRQVWQEHYFDSNNTVMVHISNLRDKLEREMNERILVTVWGVGYKIDG